MLLTLQIILFTLLFCAHLAEESNGWDVEFFPLGVRYKPAQLIGIYSAATNREIPECIIRTVRLRITSQSAMRTECRYMVSISATTGLLPFEAFTVS